MRSIWNRVVFDVDTGGAAGAAGGATGSPGASSGTGAGAGAGAGTASAGGGAAAPVVAFAESLPEAIRGEAAFKDIKSLDALANSYLHAQRMIGVDPSQVLRLPGADDAAAWDAVYGKLGRPEAADKYAFAEVKLPEGMTVDPALQTGYQEAAHKAGLSVKQADALYQWWNAQMGEKFTAQSGQTVQAQTAAIDTLRGEWGAAFDQNVALAKEAVGHYGGEKLKAELDGNGLGNSPELARIFAKLGKNLQEDGVIGRGGGDGGGINSPGEARQQISALQKDSAFLKSYTDKRDAGHADAVARMQGLYQQAYPQR